MCEKDKKIGNNGIIRGKDAAIAELLQLISIFFNKGQAGHSHQFIS
jgi:hypothetical protein